MSHWFLLVSGLIPGYWQAFWQGIGSGPVTWIFLPGTYYFHHICHETGCYRIGHPNQHGEVKCRRHLFGGIRA